jgi:hypothetical protein
MSKIILTTFAGRQDRMAILLEYAKTMLNNKLIDEYHVWNYSRNVSDDNYLRSISNIRRISSHNIDYIYLPNNVYNFSWKCEEEVSLYIGNYTLFLTNNRIDILNNTTFEKKTIKSTINQLENEFNSTSVYKENGHVIINNNNILATIHETMPLCLKIKQAYKQSCEIIYDHISNNNIYLMDVCQKRPWHDYYNYYNSSIFTNDIIIKCDDDIVFIDLFKFKEYINIVKETDKYDIIFANTINNGVAAYYQQQYLNLLPKTEFTFEYPYVNDQYGFKGSLWESGKKAEQLHTYFYNNLEKFLKVNKNTLYNIETRYSINFFAIKGSNWTKIFDCGVDDEAILTINKVNSGTIKNAMVSDFFVSHLSFGPQDADMNMSNILSNYRNIFNIYEKLINNT